MWVNSAILPIIQFWGVAPKSKRFVSPQQFNWQCIFPSCKRLSGQKVTDDVHECSIEQNQNQPVFCLFRPSGRTNKTLNIARTNISHA